MTPTHPIPAHEPLDELLARLEVILSLGADAVPVSLTQATVLRLIRAAREGGGALPLADAEAYLMTWPEGQPMTMERAAEMRAAWAAEMPGKRLIIVVGGATITPLSHLDAAWREAEGALPEGWRLHLLEATVTNEWRAVAGKRYDDGQDPFIAIAEADTPAAALFALAAKLRAAKP